MYVKTNKQKTKLNKQKRNSVTEMDIYLDMVVVLAKSVNIILDITPHAMIKYTKGQSLKHYFYCKI